MGLRSLLSNCGWRPTRAPTFTPPPDPDGEIVLYDAAAFRRREKYRENYATVCAALQEHIEFETVLDVGCANGFVLEEFADAGKSVLGIELSKAAIEVAPAEIRDRIVIADATAPKRFGRFDLVTCVEVAEHIRPEQSAGLLDMIACNGTRWVYFTAATPFQRGRGHINCRPHFFWLNEFRKRNFHLDWERTEAFLRLIADLEPAKWLALNSLILRRFGDAKPTGESGH